MLWYAHQKWPEHRPNQLNTKDRATYTMKNAPKSLFMIALRASPLKLPLILWKLKRTAAISRVVWRQFRVQISYRCRKTEDLVFRKTPLLGGAGDGGGRISKSDPAPIPSRPGMEYRVRLPLPPIWFTIGSYTKIILATFFRLVGPLILDSTWGAKR